MLDLIEHWDGATWTVQQSPNPTRCRALVNRLLTSCLRSSRSGVCRRARRSVGRPCCELGTGQLTSALSTAPSTGSGTPISLNGQFAVVRGWGTWTSSLHLDRQNPGGTHTALPDVPVDGRGFYAVTDTPRRPWPVRLHDQLPGHRWLAGGRGSGDGERGKKKSVELPAVLLERSDAYERIDQVLAGARRGDGPVCSSSAASPVWGRRRCCGRRWRAPRGSPCSPAAATSRSRSLPSPGLATCSAQRRSICRP